MKKFLLSTLVLAFVFHTTQAQTRHEIDIPDLKGYQTLKCDFHIHTVFSDGLVWPRFALMRLIGKDWMPSP